MRVKKEINFMYKFCILGKDFYGKMYEKTTVKFVIYRGDFYHEKNVDS